MTQEIATTQTTADNATEQYINTLALDTIEGKKATVNAINNAVSLKDYSEVPLTLTGIITTPGSRKGRSGLPDVPCQNTYLICDDGKAYFSQSDGIARSANMIARFFADVLADGVAVKVAETKLDNGNTLKSIEVI